MPTKRKEIGDYKTKISTYFHEHKNTKYKMNKTGLNLTLGITRSDIYHWRRREAKKWQKNFLKDYDKACQKIANNLLKLTMKEAKYQWAYLRACHPEEFYDLPNGEINYDEVNNIAINIENPRVINNE